MDYDYDVRNRHQHKPPHECSNIVCEKIINQKADVSVPIDIKPTAVVGKIQAECIGEPQITNDKCKELCGIIITQTLSVKIPIKFNVSTNVGESKINCHIAE